MKPIPELPSVPLDVPQPKSQNIEEVSDMMKFSGTIPSYDASEVILPECSIFDVKGAFIEWDSCVTFPILSSSVFRLN